MVSLKKTEIWKPIPGWEGLYEVSSLGRFKMLRREVVSKNGRKLVVPEMYKKLTPNKTNHYLMITLTENATNRHETRLAHRIVALVYIPNPDNLPEVDHLKTKMDISVNDLRWTTRSDNEKYAYKTGAKISKKNEDHPFSRKVARYLNGRLIKEYKTMKEAAQEGFSTSSIRQAIENNWKCGGFEWKYLSERKWKRRKNLKPKRKICSFKGGKMIKMYTDIEDVKKEGYDKSNIYKALKNEAITSGGFYWKYLDNKKTA